MLVRVFFAALVSSATAFASAESLLLDIKTGLWELTDTTETHGILQPQLACVTVKDLKKGAFRSKSDDRTCRHTSLTHTSTVQEESVQCGSAEGRRGTFTVAALDRDSITTTFTSDMGVAVQMKGKWLAASCSVGDENTPGVPAIGIDSGTGMPTIGIDSETGKYRAEDDCLIRAPNGFCIEEEQ